MKKTMSLLLVGCFFVLSQDIQAAVPPSSSDSTEDIIKFLEGIKTPEGIREENWIESKKIIAKHPEHRDPSLLIVPRSGKQLASYHPASKSIFLYDLSTGQQLLLAREQQKFRALHSHVTRIAWADAKHGEADILNVYDGTSLIDQLVLQREANTVPWKLVSIIKK